MMQTINWAPNSFKAGMPGFNIVNHEVRLRARKRSKNHESLSPRMMDIYVDSARNTATTEARELLAALKELKKSSQEEMEEDTRARILIREAQYFRSRNLHKQARDILIQGDLLKAISFKTLIIL